MGSLMLGWISNYVVSAFQFVAFCKTLGWKCYRGIVVMLEATIKLLSFCFSYYSSQNIMLFPNQVQLKFPSTSNLSVRREGQNASKRHTSSANQNIFHGPCTLEKTKSLMERNAYNTFKGFGKSDTVWNEEGRANWINCLHQSVLQQNCFSTFGHMK